MTKYRVKRRYYFSAAHALPFVREGHKCKRMHGHNYLLDVTVVGSLDSTGFVIDYWDLDDVVKPLIERVDHYTLNDIEGLENPTAELIAEWFFDRIGTSERLDGLQLEEVAVHEEDDAIAIVRREDAT